MTEQLLYKAEEVAAILGVSRSTVYNLIKEGKIQTVRLGPQLVRISRTEIDRYVANLEETTND